MATSRARDRVTNASQALERTEAPAAAGTDIYSRVQKQRDEIAKALPRHLDPDRFLRLALTELRTNPKLAECTWDSIAAGLMAAAQLGLEISGFRGQCYLIPRKNKRTGNKEATFQLGYKGEIDLAGRGGLIVKAETVRDQDFIEVNPAAAPAQQITHRRPIRGRRGESIGFYAIVSDRATGMLVATDYWSREEVEDHRDRFASQRNFETGAIEGPWVDDFDAMAEKTLIRAVLNRMPLPAELITAYSKERETMATSGPVIDLGHIQQAPVDTPAVPASAPPIEASASEAPPQAAEPVKCDGEHGGRSCADPHCHLETPIGGGS